MGLGFGSALCRAFAIVLCYSVLAVVLSVSGCGFVDDPGLSAVIHLSLGAVPGQITVIWSSDVPAVWASTIAPEAFPAAVPVLVKATPSRAPTRA